MCLCFNYTSTNPSILSFFSFYFVIFFVIFCHFIHTFSPLLFDKHRHFDVYLIIPLSWIYSSDLNQEHLALAVLFFHETQLLFRFEKFSYNTWLTEKCNDRAQAFQSEVIYCIFRIAFKLHLTPLSADFCPTGRSLSLSSRRIKPESKFKAE